MSTNFATAELGLLKVMSLKDAREVWQEFDRVITIEDVGFEDGLRIPDDAEVLQFVYRFDDTEQQDGNSKAATLEDVETILRIARNASADNVLIHCVYGQSRSAALALGILAERLGAGREKEAVDALLAIRPSAVCNRLILRHADALLGRRGDLTGAWSAHLAQDDRMGGIYLLRELAEQQNADDGQTTFSTAIKP